VSSRCTPATATSNQLVARRERRDPPFAGQDALFRIAVANPGRCRAATSRRRERRAGATASVAAGANRHSTLRVPTRRRGSIVLERVEIATRFPTAYSAPGPFCIRDALSRLSAARA
jgi:hypothetical protein